MSYGHNTALPGGGSTITLSPGDNTNIYQHQGRYIVATIQMAVGNNIPKGATIDFTKGNSLHSSGFVKLYGEPDWQNVPISINEADPTKGTARLGIRHDPEDLSGTINVYAKASGMWGTITPPTDAAGVTYQVLNYDPTVTLSGPDKMLVPVPLASEPNQGDQFAPNDEGGKYTTHLSCTVVDNTTVPPTKLSDNVVEWQESGAKTIGHFDNLMNTYTSKTAEYPDRLQVEPIGGLLVKDDQQGGYFIRMETNSEGVADLYLVAEAQSGSVVGSVVPRYDMTDFTPAPMSFLVVDATDTAYPRSPTVMNVTRQPDGTYTLDLDDDDDDDDDNYNDDGTTVKVTITNFPGEKAGDQIYLVINGALCAGPYTVPGSPYTDNWQWNIHVPKSAFYYSDNVAVPGKLNQVLFVAVNVGSNDLRPSSINGFYGISTQLEGEPTPGVLTAPVLSPTAHTQGTINKTWITAYGVAIDVDLQQASNGWTPKVGDVLTATAVLKGWAAGGDIPQSAVINATASVTLALTGSPPALPPLVTLTFPVEGFKGWDSKDGGSYPTSICYFVYTVQPKGSRVLINSRALNVNINTANMS